VNTTSPASFNRLIRVLAAISSHRRYSYRFYQEFLHGGRGAVDIVLRSETYSMVHMLGAFCVLFAIFGVIALYLRYLDSMGWIGPYSFVLSLLAQGYGQACCSSTGSSSHRWRTTIQSRKHSGILPTSSWVS
jgi:hypothetical protein